MITVVAALLLGGLSRSKLPETLTFTHPCDRSEVVLAALGEELGMTLKPSGSVNDDYFLVRFDDVPVEEAFDKIAKTLNATWSEKNGVTYLGRTRLQELEDAKAGQTYVGDSIKEWLEARSPKQEYTIEFAEQLIGQALPLLSTQDNANYEALRSLGDQSPLSRLVTRIVAGIDLDEISSIKLGESVQYATSPNASQRPMPNGDALKLFVQENYIHRAALDKTGAIEQASNGGWLTSLFSPYRYQTVELGRVKLTFVRDIGGIRLHLSVGRVTESQEIRIERPTGDGVPKELTSSTDEIEWSKETAQLVEVLMPLMSGQGTEVGIPENLQLLFSDPVENEFLNFFGSKWMLDTASKKGLNVVALLSDDTGFLGMLGAAQKVKEGQLWAMMPQFESSYDFELEGNWLTFAPNRRTEAREHRIDREMLRDAIRLHKRERGPSIDSLAMMFSASDNELHSMFASVIGGIATNDPSLFAIGQTMSPDLLRMYNQLPAAQKSQAHNGGVTVQVPQGSKKFNYYMNKLVFGDRSQLQPSARKDIWPNSPGYRALGPEGDPFDRLGNGFPRGSTAKFMIVERDLIYPQPTRSTSPQGFTVEALAGRIVASERLQQDNNYDFRNVFVSTAQRLVVEFSFPGAGYVYADTQLDRLPGKIEYRPITTLRKDLRDKLDAALKKERDAYKNARSGGRVIPPTS